MCCAAQSVAVPLSWGVVELVIFGQLSQIGLEFYKKGVPLAFKGFVSLPARAKPLENFMRIDHQYVAFNQIAIVAMTFHYLQFMACSSRVLWRLDQVCTLPLELLYFHVCSVHAWLTSMLARLWLCACPASLLQEHPMFRLTRSCPS